jgi:plastocyanin
MMYRVLALVALLACNSNNNKSPDARSTPPVDSHVAMIDSPVAHDAFVQHDAPSVPSTVIVVADCTGIGSADIGANITTTDEDTFNPSTATIKANQYVKFTTTGDHNFQNQPGAAPSATFSSGAPGSQTTCLQFTVAGSYPYECVVHASMGMLGTLTVN